tara:strand:- start:914 stop:1018 length:105 start_codon:yes stop_codon:yes gene_type:complete
MNSNKNYIPHLQEECPYGDGNAAAYILEILKDEI